MGKRSIVFTLGVAFALLLGLAGSVTAQGTPTSAGEIPAVLAAPPTSVFVLELHASGDQIYTCTTDPENSSEYIWTFDHPEAELFNARDEQVGTHFAGPTWQGVDGSSVVGAVLERADSPVAGSIPWLLLEATENTGNGIFSTVTYVQRLDTSGGVAPAEGCDADHVDDVVRVPYEANYAFFYPASMSATPAA